MGIDILGIDIMGVDILGIDIPALPRSHKRREHRLKIILHSDSLREKAILIAFVSAEGI